MVNSQFSILYQSRTPGSISYTKLRMWTDLDPVLKDLWRTSLALQNVKRNSISCCTISAQALIVQRKIPKDDFEELYLKWIPAVILYCRNAQIKNTDSK